MANKETAVILKICWYFTLVFLIWSDKSLLVNWLSTKHSVQTDWGLNTVSDKKHSLNDSLSQSIAKLKSHDSLPGKMGIGKLRWVWSFFQVSPQVNKAFFSQKFSQKWKISQDLCSLHFRLLLPKVINVFMCSKLFFRFSAGIFCKLWTRVWQCG